MKRAFNGTIIAICLVAGLSCSKEKNKNEQDCRTCRVLGREPEVKEQVCSDADEQAFRRRYPDVEISCSR